MNPAVARCGLMASALGVMFVVAACPGSLEEPDRFTSRCGDVPTRIFAAKCTTAGCHNAVDKSQGLDLQSPDVGKRLQGVRSGNTSSLLIDPSQPETSALYTKISTPIVGARMPLYAPNLDSHSIACTLDWIKSLSTQSVDASVADTSPVDAANDTPVQDASDQ